jgi:integrase
MNSRITPGGNFTFPGTQLTISRFGYGAMQLVGPNVWGRRLGRGRPLLKHTAASCVGTRAQRNNPRRVKAGVLAKDDPHRFGFHNLRHTLAAYLVRTRTDPKTVQALLRHSNVKTTLQLYAHSVSEDRMAAQGLALTAFLQAPGTSAVN